jgi:hypothetical protein
VGGKFIAHNKCAPYARRYDSRHLQHIVTFVSLKNLRYSIYITTQEGESGLMDLPFSLPQSRIFRAYRLTPDLKMRYGAYIHIIPEILPIFGYSQYTCNFVDNVMLARYSHFGADFIENKPSLSVCQV